MKEVKGNLWDAKTDAICITTNGFVKKNGEAVMGRGCALEAANKWPRIPHELGSQIKNRGNHVHRLITARHGYYDGEEGLEWEIQIFTFPVKHAWFEKADLKLIERSCLEIIEITNEWGFHSITIPRPGCGNGQLDWETEVKPVIEPILDDRFEVISF